MEEVAKVFYGIACLGGIAVTQFLRKSDSEVGIAISCAIFGIFGFGMYPIGLELSVENTYPVDEAAGTALIFLSGQIQGKNWLRMLDIKNPIYPILGAILIAISGAMEQEGKCIEYEAVS